TNLGALHIDHRVRLELPVPLAEHEPEESHAGAGQPAERFLVRALVCRPADEDEGNVEPRTFVRLDEHVGVVLGLEPADVQDVSSGLEARLLERCRTSSTTLWCAVRDVCRVHAIDVCVVALYGTRVCHENVSCTDRPAFGMV